MDGTFPDTLSDLLINESYQGTFGPAATWHAIDHNHVAAVSFREHQAALLEALSEGTTSFDITCMDLMMAVYRGRQRAVLLVGISPETSDRFSELESLIKSSGCCGFQRQSQCMNRIRPGEEEFHH
jgi:ABC-type lipoprotein release transport system permease subunit